MAMKINAYKTTRAVFAHLVGYLLLFLPFPVYAAAQVDVIEVMGRQSPVVNELAITNGAYVAITPSILCNTILIRSRDGDAWKFSDVIAGTDYITFQGTEVVTIPVRCGIGEVIGYVESADATDTLEIMEMR
jgi:hypothetical protein